MNLGEEFVSQSYAAVLDEIYSLRKLNSLGVILSVGGWGFLLWSGFWVYVYLFSGFLPPLLLGWDFLPLWLFIWVVGSCVVILVGFFVLRHYDSRVISQCVHIKKECARVGFSEEIQGAVVFAVVAHVSKGVESPIVEFVEVGRGKSMVTVALSYGAGEMVAVSLL